MAWILKKDAEVTFSKLNLIMIGGRVKVYDINSKERILIAIAPYPFIFAICFILTLVPFVIVQVIGTIFILNHIISFPLEFIDVDTIGCDKE